MDIQDDRWVLKGGDIMNSIHTVDTSAVPGRSAIVAKTGEAKVNIEKHGIRVKTGNLTLNTTLGGFNILQPYHFPEGVIRMSKQYRNVSAGVELYGLDSTIPTQRVKSRVSVSLAAKAE